MSKFRYSAIRSFSAVAETVDVVRRADQPTLFGAPPRESKSVRGIYVCHLDGGFQDRGAARAVVVDARSGKHGVEVTRRP